MAENSTEKSKVFFPNLDGLRFICFLTVFLYHWNLTGAARISNDTAKSIINFLFQNGNIGVNIFFVLSGFLITFLLIKEKGLKNDISLPNFYLRRILRIWPLYYLCVLLGFVVFAYVKYKEIPSPNEPANFFYYLFFIANFDQIHLWKTIPWPHSPDFLPLVVLWSVAVEEQFYITWPVILKYSISKLYPYIFGAIIAFTLIFRCMYTGHDDADYAMRYFHTFSLIGDMALGGLMAYYCSFNSKLLNYITRMPKWHVILLYSITIAAVLFRKTIFHPVPMVVIERLVFAILFAFIIAEQNFANNSFFKFSSFKSISKLGIYTYGLYCLQFIGILAMQGIADKIGFGMNSLWENIIGCLGALAITIIVSVASYHIFEKHFLKLKDKFAVIVKG